MAASFEYEWALHTITCNTTTCGTRFTVLASSTTTECTNCYAKKQAAMNDWAMQFNNFQRSMWLLQPCPDCNKSCARPWNHGTGCHLCCRKANAVIATFRGNEEYTFVQQLLLQRARNAFYNANPTQKEALRSDLFKNPMEVTEGVTYAAVLMGKFNYSQYSRPF